jgi:transposase
MVAVRTRGLRVLQLDGELEVLRMLIDRREALTRRRVQTVNRLQALLGELLPGQAKKDITALQAKAMLATVRPRDIAGRTCRRIAAEELAELVTVEAKIKKSTAELKSMVLARGSRLMDLHGVGPVVAARVLADVGDVARFADRNWFGLRDTRRWPVFRRSGPWVAQIKACRVEPRPHRVVVSRVQVPHRLTPLVRPHPRLGR